MEEKERRDEWEGKGKEREGERNGMGRERRGGRGRSLPHILCTLQHAEYSPIQCAETLPIVEWLLKSTPLVTQVVSLPLALKN